jgi:MEMO1 family protein
MQTNPFNNRSAMLICASLMTGKSLKNRKPCAAGRFYPGKADDLEMQLRQLFSRAIPRRSENNPLALLVPHAGFMYSGGIAATAYNRIEPNKHFDRIFIIGSSHTSHFTGASIYCQGHFETPLGVVPVDLELAKKLIHDHEIINCNSEAHLFEHSIEVQLPFLQHHLKPDFKILPVIIGTSTNETAQRLAEIFKPYLTERNLFVISSDFSHYPDYSDALEIDLRTAEAIKSNKASNLIDILDANRRKSIPGLSTSLCGWSSVLTLLYMTEQIPDLTVDLIQYKNSGDYYYHDKDRVVGYWAVSFAKEVAPTETINIALSTSDKKILLKVAREAISEYLTTGKIPEIDPPIESPLLQSTCGAFVTLNKNEHLRGCIGHMEANLPMWRVVQQMAVASATKDYRFSRVDKKELCDLKIEISIITPLKRIKSADEFILGKHGIYIKNGPSSGTFLPQVALQTGWSKEELLGHCAQEKAGLAWSDWKSAELYTYEAQVFKEDN